MKRTLIASFIFASFCVFPVFAQYAIDLDVTHISRTPLYPGYRDLNVTNGVDPAPVPGTSRITKHSPETGETVTYAAYIINKGRRTSRQCSYLWKIDGEEVSRGNFKALRGGANETIILKREWSEKPSIIEFVVDSEGVSGDEFAGNNKCAFKSDAWQVLVTVDRKDYETINRNKNIAGSFSFEDYIQTHIGFFNEKLASSNSVLNPDGCQAQIVLDSIVIYKDEKELVKFVGGNKKVFFDKFDIVLELSAFLYGESFQFSAEVFSHEILQNMGFQLGIVLYSSSNIRGSANFVTGEDGYPLRLSYQTPIYCYLSGDENDDIADLTIAALNTQSGIRRGYYGNYLYAIPEKVSVLVLDNMGKPIPNAILRFYQSSPTNDGSKLTNNIVFAGRTDINGVYTLPNRKVNDISTLAGIKKTANPFGEIDIFGRNSVMLVSITARGFTEYKWLSLFELNRQWFKGNQEHTTISYMTSICTDGAPKPPILEGDFYSHNDLLLRWHKYPRLWVEYFRLYSRGSNLTGLPNGILDTEKLPYSILLQTSPGTGVWDHRVSIESGFHEFYLTSVGTFERESSPSRLYVAPSQSFRGMPVTVTVDEMTNIVYSAENTPIDTRTWRLNERRRFTTPFIASSGDIEIFNITDILYYDGRYIATCTGMDAVLFFDRYGNILYTFGHKGDANGEFLNPTGAAVKNGMLYVCDTGNNRVQIFSLADGEFIKVFGKAGSGQGGFLSPSGIAVSDDGYIAVSDMGNNRVQLFNSDYEFLKQLDGLNEPRGIDYYGGRYYIADSGNARVIKTDKNLRIVKEISSFRGEPFSKPMDVWVHHYPQIDKRRAFASIFIADYGRYQICEEVVPPEETENRSSGKAPDVKRAVIYGDYFDLDDPDSFLKPMQVVIYGLYEDIYATHRWTMKLDELPPGLIIDSTEAPFIVTYYEQAFVDYHVRPESRRLEPMNNDGEDYALASKGATAKGFENSDEVINGIIDATAGAAQGIWRKINSDTLIVTLKKSTQITDINIVLPAKGYQDYTLEVSDNGETWTEVKQSSMPDVIRNIRGTLVKFHPQDSTDDMAHIKLDYENGYRGVVRHEIPGGKNIRHIKITSKHSDNESSIKIIEVQVYGPQGQ